MIQPFRRYLFHGKIQCLGLFPGIQHAQRGRLFQKHVTQLFLTERIRQKPIRNPPHHIPIVLLYNLNRLFFQKPSKRRLRRRTEQHTALINGQQCRYRPQTGFYPFHGKRLNLVKYHHTSEQTVQPDTGRRPRRVHGFKKRHGCCHHNRRIPALRVSPVVFRIPIRIKIHTGMDCHNLIVAKNLTKHGDCLVNDGPIRNHVHDPAKSMRCGLFQRECHTGTGLSAAGRYRQTVKPRRILSARTNTGIQNNIPNIAHIPGNPRYIRMHRLDF